jgi:hypothetical protein
MALGLAGTAVPRPRSIFESDNHRVAGHDADLLDDAGGAPGVLCRYAEARRRAMSGRSWREPPNASMASSRRSCRRSRRTSA